MAHFAKIGFDNEVIGIMYLPNYRNVDPITGVEDEALGIKYLTENHGHELWKQCSINTFQNSHSEGRTPLRKNYPSVGWRYDSAKDAFIPPDSLKPFESWIWDDDIYWWKAPVDMPTTGITDEERAGQYDENGAYIVPPYFYKWDEENTTWVKTNQEE